MNLQSLSGAWQFRKSGEATWLPATVPGCVHTDLLAAGKLPDPFLEDNEFKVAWVAESDWEYAHSFTPPSDLLAEEQIFLVCDGLDTLAEVILNGVSLGKTENMHRVYRWDVKSILQPGENVLLVTFASPVRYAAEKQAQRPLNGVSQAIPGGPYLRKAPCQFGWDWGPQLPPIGIWKDLRLEGYSSARLTDVHLRQAHKEGKVTLTIALKTESWTKAPLSAKVIVKPPSGALLTAQAQLSNGVGMVEVPISNPQLWYPNGYGAQPLYEVQVELLTDGKVLDRRTYQTGLRTIRLRQEPDEWGESFEFVVNGIPVFAKGSNWIPADSFPTRLTDAHLEHLIRSAAETHQNMLRVWGGGYYEEERFYNLCDRYGILVWQEFSFSCSVYPLNDPAFVENVHREAIDNIRRIRHRASLALWCGNNEMEEGWEFWGWNTPALQDLKAAYETFFFHTLPAWVAAEDPDTRYWPSSPSANTPFINTQSERVGDMHYWGVWHRREPFTSYRKQYPRFMSEFGFQSLPPLETIKTYASPQDWNMTSYIMELHQKNASGNGLIIGQMTASFRMPKDFPSLVYLSMVLQAEGIRYGVEHYRRHRQRTAGTLYWQLNDCWPVASWSSLDYYGRWKALHYAARRFYAPLLLSLLDEANTIDIYLTSDLLHAWQGEVRWSLQSLDGAILKAGSLPVNAEPLASTIAGRLEFDLNGDEKRRTILVCELLQDGKRQAMQVLTFAPNKHVEFRNPGLKVIVGQQGNSLVLSVSAQSLARFVELGFNGADVIFSDNYFDIPAGQEVTVTCPLPAGWTLAQAQAALQVRSLYDSFA
ncbi:MAG TPA: glycoside hydrolase family 2 protein [Anaerolineaceae bacterium]